MPAERQSFVPTSWPHVSAGICTPQDLCRCPGDLVQPLFPPRGHQPTPQSSMLPLPHPFPPVGPRYHVASSGGPTQTGQLAGYAVGGVASPMHPLQHQQQHQQQVYQPHRQYMDGSQLPLQYAREPALQLMPFPASTAAEATRRSSTPIVSLPPPAMMNLQQGAGYPPYQQQQVRLQGPGWGAGPSMGMGGDKVPLPAAPVKASPRQMCQDAGIISNRPKPAAARTGTRAAAAAAAAAAGGGSDASDSKGDEPVAPKRGRARKMTDRERYDITVTELEARKASLLQLVSNLERSNAGVRRLQAKQAQQLAAKDTTIRRLWLLQEQTVAAVSLQHQSQQAEEQGPAPACSGSSGGGSSGARLPSSCVVLLEVPLATGLAALLRQVQAAVPREPLTSSQLLAKLCGVGPTLLEAAGGNVVTALVTHLEEQQVKGYKASAVAAAITGVSTIASSSAAGEHARAEAAGYVLQLWQQLVKALAAASVAAAGGCGVPSRDQQQILAVTRSLLWHLVTAEASLVLRVMSAGRQPSGQAVLSAAGMLPPGTLSAVATAAAAAAACASNGSPASSIQEASEGGTEDFSCFAVPGSPVRPPAAAGDGSSFTGPAASDSLAQLQGTALLAPAVGAGAPAGLLPAIADDMLLDQFLDELLDDAAVELAADERWRDTFLGEMAAESSSAWGPRANTSSSSLLTAQQATPLPPPAAGASLTHPVLRHMHLTTRQTQTLAQHHQDVTGQQKQLQLGVCASHQQVFAWLQACSSNCTSGKWSPLADVVEGSADPVSALLGGEAARLGNLLWAWLGPQSPLSPAQQASCLAHAYPAFPDILTLSEALQVHHQAPQPSHAYINNRLHG